MNCNGVCIIWFQRWQTCLGNARHAYSHGDLESWSAYARAAALAHTQYLTYHYSACFKPMTGAAA